MAEQLSVMTKLLVELRTRLLWLMGLTAFAFLLAVIAFIVAANR